MKPGKLNIGLIGAGRIGRVHAENISLRIPAADLRVVADVYGDAARQCAAQFGIPQSAVDYHDLLESREVEAIVICSSTDTHARIIEEAAAAGKHIFCEKPIAHDLAAIDQALAAVARAGVKLQIGFNRRFDASYMRVRQAISNGEIGQLQLLHLISRDPAPPPLTYIRASGGMFMDMTIHDFDMVRFLTGSEVETVYTMAGVTVDPAIGAAGDVDTAVIMLRFAGGVIGTIDNCRRAVYGYDQRVEALGSGGAVNTANHYPNSAVVSDGRAVRRDLPLNFFMERYADSFRAEMQAFVDAIVHDQPVPVSGNDGRVPVIMALAALKSHLEGRAVRLSDIAAI
jgi:myo-inositol 2-dehydrogenase/D-chiro-inositol 1-dehydrogenase